MVTSQLVSGIVGKEQIQHNAENVSAQNILRRARKKWISGHPWWSSG